jgi:hypothetical protein
MTIDGQGLQISGGGTTIENLSAGLFIDPPYSGNRISACYSAAFHPLRTAWLLGGVPGS